MDDVHLDTPPASTTLDQEMSSNPQQQEQTDAFKGDIIRSNLGQSIFNDFGYYRDILEEHVHINNFSKKMIFALHRAEPKDYLPQFSAASEALIEFKEKHETVLKLFHRAAIDLQGPNYFRYQRSISGAMQEYIEAMTLEYYLIHGQLMPKATLEADLVFMTTQEQLNNPDLIIGIGQFGGGGGGSGGGGGGGGRGKFNKNNRNAPYNKDKRDGAKRPGNAPPATQLGQASDGVKATTGTNPSNESSANQPSPMAIDNDSVINTASSSASAPMNSSAPPQNLTRLTLSVTDEDYLLGIADLTGELMRLAINTLGQSLLSTPQDQDSSNGPFLPSPEERVQQILFFLRNIKGGFDGLSLTKMSPISKKMGVLNQSLNKIEMACYNVKVRGAEYPPEILRQMLMSGQDLGGSSGNNDTGNDDEE
ncbi:hypothetical protein BGZ51_002937 [Haplosporangium sp. Z 767]|nr:hypothetical protein BGZ51_002937 [Haplosporangium sp. Z 767]